MGRAKTTLPDTFPSTLLIYTTICFCTLLLVGDYLVLKELLCLTRWISSVILWVVLRLYNVQYLLSIQGYQTVREPHFKPSRSHSGWNHNRCYYGRLFLTTRNTNRERLCVNVGQIENDGKVRISRLLTLLNIYLHRFTDPNILNLYTSPLYGLTPRNSEVWVCPMETFPTL